MWLYTLKHKQSYKPKIIDININSIFDLKINFPYSKKNQVNIKDLYQKENAIYPLKLKYNNETIVLVELNNAVFKNLKQDYIYFVVLNDGKLWNYQYNQKNIHLWDSTRILQQINYAKENDKDFKLNYYLLPFFTIKKSKWVENLLDVLEKNGISLDDTFFSLSEEVFKVNSDNKLFDLTLKQTPFNINLWIFVFSDNMQIIWYKDNNLINVYKHIHIDSSNQVWDIIKVLKLPSYYNAHYFYFSKIENTCKAQEEFFEWIKYFKYSLLINIFKYKDSIYFIDGYWKPRKNIKEISYTWNLISSIIQTWKEYYITSLNRNKSYSFDGLNNFYETVYINRNGQIKELNVRWNLQLVSSKWIKYEKYDYFEYNTDFATEEKITSLSLIIPRLEIKNNQSLLNTLNWIIKQKDTITTIKEQDEWLFENKSLNDLFFEIKKEKWNIFTNCDLDIHVWYFWNISYIPSISSIYNLKKELYPNQILLQKNYSLLWKNNSSFILPSWFMYQMNNEEDILHYVHTLWWHNKHLFLYLTWLDDDFLNAFVSVYSDKNDDRVYWILWNMKWKIWLYLKDLIEIKK